ncbi:MAG: DUF6443 domain-containing protein, partial [Flavobacteriales bacterium]|nr:DUF6443 domain-containing protein [Flavobacteriales bacterium]
MSSAIGYRSVEIRHGKNADNGKTITQFTSPAEFPDVIFHKKPFPNPITQNYKTGLPIYQATFKKESNGSFSKVNSKTLNYAFEEDTVFYFKVGYGKFPHPTFVGPMTDIYEDLSSTGLLIALGTAYNNLAYTDKWAFAPMQLKTGYAQISSETDSTFYDNGVVVETNNYNYSSNLRDLKKQIASIDGKTYTTQFTYSNELNPPSSQNPYLQGFQSLQDNHVFSVIEEQSFVNDGSGNKLSNSQLHLYTEENGIPLYAENRTIPLSTLSSNYSSINLQNGSLNIDSRYETTYLIYDYNPLGKPALYGETEDLTTAYLFDKDDKNPIAKAIYPLSYWFQRGDKAPWIAYSNFETYTQSQGRWILDPNQIRTIPHTGRLGYELNAPGISYANNLNEGTSEPIQIDLWVLAVNGGTINFNIINASGQTQTISQAIGGHTEWQQIKLDLGAIQALEINSSSTLLIDDLKMFPQQVQVETYVYNELNLLSATGDVNNRYGQFVYDDQNRLQRVKNHLNEILKDYDYQNFVTNGVNKITETSYRKSVFSDADISQLEDEDKNTKVTYMDGLGRTSQEILIGHSPLKRDIVSALEYDAQNRVSKMYLPFTEANNNGNFVQNANTKRDAFYGGTNSYAESEKRYENSPTKKVIAESRPGSTWRLDGGHNLSFENRTNVMNEVRKFKASGISTTYYDANELYVTEKHDENGHRTLVYKDKLKHLIMEEKEGAQTYYVYNDLGKVKFIIPPMTVAQMTNSGIFNCNNPSFAVYSYIYDNQGNIIRKSIPGKAQEFYYYDRLDRLVMTKDAEGVQLFTKYDALSRPVVKGKYTGTSIPNNTNGLFESEYNGTFGYSLGNSFPSSNTEVYSVTYYDHYDLDRNGTIDNTESPYIDLTNDFPVDSNKNINGMHTASMKAFFEAGTSNIIGYT